MAQHATASSSAQDRLSGRAAADRAQDAQPFIMLVSKSPLPVFTIPYPQPPAETNVADLRKAILDIYCPPKKDQTTITYAEQLRLTTLNSWRLESLTLDLHQNSLIDPRTRESAVQQEGYRLEDGHECSLIEDGDEIHIGLKQGHNISQLQLPNLGPKHVYSAPMNVVSLTRKGTLSQPPPYSVLPPSEPSSHSSSVGGQPNARYHSHSHVSDWRSPFRVVTASNTAAGVTRRESHGANGIIGAASGAPVTAGSALRQTAQHSGSNGAKKANRRRTSQAQPREIAASSQPRGNVLPESVMAASPPTYSAGPGTEALVLPPTARVIGSGVQGTAANVRKRSGSRQNSSSSAMPVGAAVASVPLITTTTVGGAGLLDGLPAASSRPFAEPESFAPPKQRSSGPIRTNEEERTRAANGAGIRRSSGASKDAKASFKNGRPPLAKNWSSGYQSYVSTTSVGKSATATATVAFLQSPTSTSTPPIVNLSPFPEQVSAAGSGNPTSSEVSAAMLKHLRRARSSFTDASAASGAVSDSNGENLKPSARPPPEDQVDEESDVEPEGDGDEGVDRSQQASKLLRRKNKGKGKEKDKEAWEEEQNQNSALKADKRYRDVQAALQKEIARQQAADGARVAQFAEEAAKKEEERKKREEEERKQAIRDKWELWEEVKRREKKEMKERKRRGDEVPEGAIPGPASQEAIEDI
ncbi:folylpolyglutamate synthase [Tilletia horrida]|uniref:Folylpolyglutamate synthase n=1 Tax=Tilletia horrida TaxID=155126 RepID=A0AAN6JTE1_9BASI|nr:folylpolyglutamate synthase [Tilletia horrida]KAK0569510.1 folylpolyglutamate synthase [Tilletia horrida]